MYRDTIIILIYLTVLRICTDDRINDTTTAYIDTIEAPKFRNTYCKCRISPSRKKTNLLFVMINVTHRSPLKFKLKGKVIDTKINSQSERIKKNTELNLKFISHSTRTREGACLAIYPSTYRIYISFIDYVGKIKILILNWT
jgi:hypothetical protein